MISFKAAESMSYLHYKREFWRLMLAYWHEYGSRHPERAEFIAERITVAEAQVAKWATG